MEEYLFNQLQDTVENQDDDEEVAINKEVVYLNDSNNGTYEGNRQILFDLTPWSNMSQNYVDYSNAYIQIPILIRTTYDVDATKIPPSTPPVASDGFLGNDCNQYSIGLKNGFYSMIDAIHVSVNGKTVVENQSFLNLFTNFKVMSTFSQDDLVKWGPSLGIYPDNAGSFNFSATQSPEGDGYTNIRNLESDYYTTNETANPGFKLRQQNSTAYDPSTQGQSGMGSGNTLPTAGTSTIIYGMNQFTRQNTSLLWQIVGTIRLKDISSFFENAALLRGVAIRITLYYNSTTTVTKTNFTTDNDLSTMELISVNQIAGNTNPILISSLEYGANAYIGNNTTPPAADRLAMNRPGTYTTKIAIGSVDGVSIAGLKNCRIYASAYKLNPVIDKMISTKYSKKTVKYNDVFSFRLRNITAGNFNEIIGNGFPNMKYVVVIPHAHSAAGGVFKNTSIDTIQSPFDTAGSTTLPLANIHNLQISVSGKNLFNNPIEYSWENFLFELSSINALHGAALTGSTSGLLNQHMFNHSYRYYVCDLSRRLKSEDNVPKSLTIIGNNTSGVALDLYCFVIYQKQITFNMITGAIEKE